MEKFPQYISYALIHSSPTGVREQGCVFEVYYGESDSAGSKLSEVFLTYILKNALCTRCMEIIREMTHLSTCENPPMTDSQWSSPRNRMCYISSANLTEFRKSWDRERARFRRFERKSKLSRTPLPPEGILFQLKDKQENRCYYCFNEFDANSSNLKPHLDHFVSVANGGSNSIFNLVYACGRCNREKCSENGEQFIKRSSVPATESLVMIEGLLKDHYRTEPAPGSSKHGPWAYELLKLLHQKQRAERERTKTPIGLFPIDMRRHISKMREAVREWKEQFRPELLSEVERMREKHLRGIPDTKSEEFAKWLDEEYRLLLRIECIKGELEKVKPKPSER